jgi:hypothetical protein
VEKFKEAKEKISKDDLASAYKKIIEKFGKNKNTEKL